MGGGVIGGDLFRRFFLRFLLALAVALGVLIGLFHLFQREAIFTEWKRDLQQEAGWLARHTGTADPAELAAAWRATHDTVRLRLVDGEWRPVADSHPERGGPDLAAIREDGSSWGYLSAVAEMPGGGRVVMSRRALPGFPYSFHGELFVAALAIVGLMAAVLYPLVRSMSRTFGELTEIAGQVSAGRFGRTLGSGRPGELGALVDAFDEMSRKLAEAERLDTRLLHDVSHEFRSPLARIQVMAESLRDHPEDAEERIRGITQEVALLDRLVGDLVETARIESEARSPEWDELSLVAWAREILARLEARVAASGLAWEVRLPERDAVVSGDAQRLGQALGNLVDNAVHALGDTADGRIEVELAIGAREWTLTVADNGPGIPEADRPHVFRRFYRVGDARERGRGGGVGLGLTLVRAIVEAHGGTAAIESPVGGGTRAVLRLPLGVPGGAGG